MRSPDAVPNRPTVEPTLARISAPSLIALMVLAAVGCGTSNVTAVRSVTPTVASCEAEPVGTVTAFLSEPNEIGTFRIDGTVGVVPATSSAGLSRLEIHDMKGMDHTLHYQVPGQALPVREGGSYSFAIAHVGRFPPASALLISDDGGLLFAGVSDIGAGAMVLENGIEGFKIEILASTCASRPPSDCYESVRNATLRVTRGTASADLSHGQSADLGGYRVTCLTAEEFTPSGLCADAGRITLSYTIRRLDP